MGARKHNTANRLKEERRNVSFAKLNDCPTSPRKMRLVADMVRGVDVFKALSMLQHNPKDASGRLEKLIKSAITNWEAKNEGKRIEDAKLVVKDVFVDSATMLKRIQPAPQGRAHRVRKRSNHVTVIIDSI
jgi:large subunit ribosomal protein L22